MIERNTEGLALALGSQGMKEREAGACPRGKKKKDCGWVRGQKPAPFKDPKPKPKPRESPPRRAAAEGPSFAALPVAGTFPLLSFSPLFSFLWLNPLRLVLT
jgi:hypothetical protein